MPAFKTKNDSINKQNEYWGFKGMSGQMFFNLLYNNSQDNGYYSQLDSLLKNVIEKPRDINEANEKILSLMNFCEMISVSIINKKGIPRKGSIPFFLSYFWSISDFNEWPIYYNSIIKSFEQNGISFFDNAPNLNYVNFYQINNEIINYFSSKCKSQITLWQIEHAFYWLNALPAPANAILDSSNNNIQINNEIPSSYIPPIVSILPQLANRSDGIELLCDNSGISVEKLFEQRISILFKIMGFTVENLGQGYGRVPDGVAICSEYHYAIIFDAKIRKEGYNTLGTDDRAIKEYIRNHTEILKRRGIRKFYFLIISSKFSADFDDFIRNMKMETDIDEIIFIEANALLLLLEQKLRSNEFGLGPGGLQNFLSQSGIITEKDIL